MSEKVREYEGYRVRPKEKKENGTEEENLNSDHGSFSKGCKNSQRCSGVQAVVF